LNATHQVNVSWFKFMKFAITVGQPIFRAAFPNTVWSVPLTIYKAFAVTCALEFNRRRIERTRLYKLLEQSEKANVSYWIGMAVAGISADYLLNVSRLLHAGAFKRAGYLNVIPDTNRLADLIGEDENGNWHIIEAKARQYRPSADDKRKWKDQTTTILSIRGCTPVTRSYSLALIGDDLRAEMVDPEQIRERVRRRVDFEPGTINRGYYEPFREWLAEEARLVTFGDHELKVRPVKFAGFNNLTIYIGMSRSADTRDGEREFTKLFQPIDTETGYVGADGISVLAEEGISGMRMR